MTRGRRPALEPSIATNLHLPESIRTRIDLLLLSDVEQRVPKGAYQRFFLGLVQDFFTLKTQDIGTWLGLPPGQCIVRAHPDHLAKLVAALEAHS